MAEQVLHEWNPVPLGGGVKPCRIVRHVGCNLFFRDPDRMSPREDDLMNEILRLRGLLEEAEDCLLSFGVEDPELLSRIRQALHREEES